MKLSTPIGATCGNSAQWRSPAVVWMMAVGCAAAAGEELAGLRTGGFGIATGGVVEAACAAPSREVEIIRTSVCSRVRMDAPVGVFASFNCTTVDPGLLVESRASPPDRDAVNRRTTWTGEAPVTPLSFLFHGPHFAAHSLGLAEDAEQVAAQNLPNIVGAVAAIEQGLCDLWQVGGGVNALGGRAAYAVKIRAQADVVDACDFRDMVDVIDEGAQRRARDFGGPLAFDPILVKTA